MNKFIKVAFAVAFLSLGACNKNQDTDAQAAQDAEAQEEVIDATPIEDIAEDVEDEVEDVIEAAEPQIDEALLEQEEWALNTLNGEALKVQDQATISFDAEGRIAGNSGCNRYMGTYTVPAEGEIKIELGGSTMMMCGDDAMDVEKQLTELLPQLVEYEIDEDGSLTLRTAEGDELTD